MSVSRVCLACVSFIVAVSLRAQVPQMIHYQGRIVVGATHFEGQGLFKFALVSTNAAGAVVSLWSNNGSSVGGAEPSAAVNVPVVKGLYSVLLGDASLPNMQPVTPAVFSSPCVFLRVWFNDGTSGFQLITPDQRLSSVGYALVAGTVPDRAIAPPKLEPGIAGQVLMTDESGHANWAPAASVVTHAAIDDPDAVATADPAENTCLIQIDGLFTNEVVICGGLWVELDTALVYDEIVRELPCKRGHSTHSAFVFEYGGAATNLLASETNSYPRSARDIRIIIRNSLGNEQCRWTLQEMEVARVLSGTAGRVRFVCERTEQYTGYDAVRYLQTPEAYANNYEYRTGYRGYFLEISGKGGYAPLDLSYNPRERTLTMDVGYNEIGQLFKWFKDVSEEPWSAMEIRDLAWVKFVLTPGGGLQEVQRHLYFDTVPIRYEVVSGFGQFERVRIRVVLKYRYRERA